MSIFRKIATCFCLLVLLSCQEENGQFELTERITVFKNPGFQPPLVEDEPDAVSPEGMVYVPGGYTQIGAEKGPDSERPMFWVKIKPFFMDEHPVTVAEFRRFVEATGYETEAEKFGNAGCFDEKEKEWVLKKEATWELPFGKNQPKAEDNHPVTQVSWNDAATYAKWAGKRLPHEFEWEHAARNGVNSRSLYPFGNRIVSAKGKFLANVWTGIFPDFDAVKDGFHYTSPVGYFGKSPLGLTDMTGNVWEWCDNWRSDYGEVLKERLPKKYEEKAQRGGSFLCEPRWCHGYRVSGRSFCSPETSLMHVGFRCVKDFEK